MHIAIRIFRVELLLYFSTHRIDQVSYIVCSVHFLAAEGAGVEDRRDGRDRQ